MRILQVHNFYQRPGGEDETFQAEYELLTERGERVEQYSVHNDAINQMPVLQAGARAIWNGETYRAIQRRIGDFKPDLLHAHNTFPLLSPALHYAAHSRGVPVIQTIQNYRLICPSATFYRDGHVCEDCMGRVVPYNGVLHACYRSSRPATATVAFMLTVHRALRTWHTKVSRYIAVSQFGKDKLVQGGLPPEKIAVKPNFLSRDPLPGDGSGRYVLFAGRLAEEKGLRTLLKAWEHLGHIPLKIAGDGPLRDFVCEQSASLANVEVLGHRNRSEMWPLMKGASLLVVPSEWYEGLPLTIVEALACGTPIACSDIGSLRELVEENVNGIRFRAGDPDDLARRLNSGFSTANALRVSTRRSFELQYTAERNYHLLREIYADAVARHASAGPTRVFRR